MPANGKQRANTDNRSWWRRCEARVDQEGRGEAERRDWKTDAGAAAQHARYHPSLIRAPPLPCPSVAPSLTFGPSHNLCPLSPSAERLISRSPQQPLWFSCDLPSNHGIVVEFFPHQVLLLEFGIWLWSSVYTFPLSCGDYHRNSVCACVHVLLCVCVCSALCLFLMVLNGPAEVHHHERESPSPRVWVSAPV